MDAMTASSLSSDATVLHERLAANWLRIVTYGVAIRQLGPHTIFVLSHRCAGLRKAHHRLGWGASAQAIAPAVGG